MNLYESHFSIPKKIIGEDELKNFLKILKWTVSISDDDDESHALYLHSLPHPSNYPYEPKFKKTRMGGNTSIALRVIAHLQAANLQPLI